MSFILDGCFVEYVTQDLSSSYLSPKSSLSLAELPFSLSTNMGCQKTVSRSSNPFWLLGQGQSFDC